MRATGLRTQLLGGLSIIILVTSISVGAIMAWTLRSQAAELELENARLLGSAVSNVLAAALDRQRQDPAILQRAVAVMALASSVRFIEVTDLEAHVLVRSQEGKAQVPRSGALSAAVSTGRQVVRSPEEAGGMLEVSTPIFLQGRVAGGVRLHLVLGPDRFGWPRLFWVLMIIDGFSLVLFVGLVATRSVIRPVVAMQRAAARVARGDLQVRLSESGATELASLAGSFNAMTASVQDQLERLERQRGELAASREVLIRSEKLASVGRLAAGVAHEVGNPLQSIVGFTEMLLQGGLNPEEERDFLRRVRDETQRIHVIIRELLDFARPVSGEREAVDLRAVVEQSLQLVGPQKRLRDVQVELRGLDDALPQALASSQRLVQVLVNLLLNAADAMKGRGLITITARPVAEDRPAAEGRPRQVELSLQNDGPAILPADRQRIFDPFFTTKDPGKGTGLGLAVALSIVESYGGSMELADGEPTTFVIRLPVWDEARPDPTK